MPHPIAHPVTIPASRTPSTLALGMILLCLGACTKDNALLGEGGLLAGPPRREVKAPDFVASSRGGDRDFMPVGVSAPARPIKARTAASRQALEAELEGARGANQARGRSAEGAARSVGRQP